MPWPKLGSLHTHGVHISSSLYLEIQLSRLVSAAIAACMECCMTEWYTAHAALVDKHQRQQDSIPGPDPMCMQ